MGISGLRDSGRVVVDEWVGERKKTVVVVGRGRLKPGNGRRLGAVGDLLICSITGRRRDVKVEIY